MKKSLLVLFLFSFVMSFASLGQDNKKLSREDRRDLEKVKNAELDSVYAKQIKQALAERKWVLEATQLSNEFGETVNVNSNLNFIGVNGNKAYIQLGRESGMGSNGVGGVTLDVTVSKYDVQKDKKGTYFIHFVTISQVGSFDITINMNSTGQMATATIQGNTSNRITYIGQVVPYDRSTVYKGTPLF